MSFTRWLRNLKSAWQLRTRSGNGRRAARSRPAPGYRPRLEALDDRCLLSAGAVDTTFGSGGVVTTAIGPNAAAAAVAVYPNAGTANDSKIVVLGSITPRIGGTEFALARYNTHGSLDTSFAGTGTVTTSIGSTDAAPQAIAIQSDGKVLAAGWAFQSHTDEFALTRYTTSGSLDKSFGGKGIVTTNFTGSGSLASDDFATAVVLQSDGKIVLAGLSRAPNDNIGLARYNTDGSLDTSFGSGGKVTTSYTSIPGSVGGRTTWVKAVGLEPDGKIVVFGASQFAGFMNHPVVSRYTTSGVLDTTFGGTGIVVLTQVSVVSSNGGNPAQAPGVVQGDGRVVVEGADRASGSADLARLNLDGSLDSTFGTGGIAFEGGFYVDRSHPSIALQSDGKFVIGAGSETVRFLSSGAPDTTFGTNGISAAAPAPFSNSEALAIQPDGGIVLVDSPSVNRSSVFALVRFFGHTSSTGDPLFIGDGKDDTVRQFDAGTGAFQGTFVSSGSGGLHGPRGVLFDHNGNLLVANQDVNLPINGDVLRYDGATGAFDNQVVSPSDPHAPFAPRGIILTSDDTLYVADFVAPDNVSDGKIDEYRYNETTGTTTFLAEIDHPAGFTGEFHPRGLVIGPDGMLYLSVRNLGPTGGAVLRFHPHSGAFLGTFVSSTSTNDLQRPEGLVFGPDGNLYITSFRASTSDTDKIDIFAGPQGGKPGSFLGGINLDQVGGDRAFAQALLFGPDGKLFVPITGGDPHTTGTVRRYDVTTKTFDIFVTSAHLGQPLYLTFSQTDPATLDYVTADAAQVQPNGDIVLAGESTAGAGTAGTTAFGLVRFLPAQPQIGSFTASPNPITAGRSLTLIAGNILDANPNATITQVAFYVDSNSDGQLEPDTDALLGYGTQTSPGVRTFTFTVKLTPGTYTLFAQAEDSYGVFGDPLALTLQVL